MNSACGTTISVQMKIIATESSIQVCLGEKRKQKQVMIPFWGCWYFAPLTHLAPLGPLPLLVLGDRCLLCLTLERLALQGILKVRRDKQLWAISTLVREVPCCWIVLWCKEDKQFWGIRFSLQVLSEKLDTRQAWIHSMSFCCGFPSLLTLLPGFPLGCRSAPRPLLYNVVSALFSPVMTLFLYSCFVWVWEVSCLLYICTAKLLIHRSLS